MERHGHGFGLYDEEHLYIQSGAPALSYIAFAPGTVVDISHLTPIAVPADSCAEAAQKGGVHLYLACTENSKGDPEWCTVMPSKMDPRTGGLDGDSRGSTEQPAKCLLLLVFDVPRGTCCDSTGWYRWASRADAVNIKRAQGGLYKDHDCKIW